jgi:hypothetical protein
MFSTFDDSLIDNGFNFENRYTGVETRTRLGHGPSPKRPRIWARPVGLIFLAYLVEVRGPDWTQ